MTGRPDVFFDTCTLWNFAAVDRLSLLLAHFAGCARWTEAVALEVRRCAVDEPRLTALFEPDGMGDAVSVDTGVGSLLGIEQTRRALGGVTAPPTLHLGEAQTIYHLGEATPAGIFATDDRLAQDLARHRGIQVIDSCDILCDCYQSHRVGCPEAYDLLRDMQRAGRGAVVPENHYMVCPPRE